MKIFAETERLILRELLPQDVAGMFEMESDADVHRYVGRKPVQTLQQAADVIEFIRAQYISNGIGRWAVIHKSTQEFIGWSGLKLITEPINGHVNHYDLGYRLMKKHWGKGYASESAVASRDYAFDVLKTEVIYATADMDNTASRSVLEKTGLNYVETFTDAEGDLVAWYKLERPFA